jgi:hypothetical protein
MAGEWSVLYPCRFLTLGRTPWCPLNRRRCGLQNRSERFGEAINMVSLPRIERVIGCQSLGLVSILTELFPCTYNPKSDLDLLTQNRSLISIFTHTHTQNMGKVFHVRY